MILVTGGTGLVGAHLLYHLTQKNDKITAIYRTEKRREYVKKIFSYYTEVITENFAKIKWIQADITDIPSLEFVFRNNITTVYHCAALVSFDSKNYEKMRQVNINGTANMVNISIERNIEKFCFVSSIATIGNAIDRKIIKEENQWSDSDKNSGYAITKYGAEMEVWRGSQEGLDVVIVNPGIILGSGFWQEGSGKLFSQIKNGFNFYTQGITGFVSVQDVVKAMILLVNANIKNQRFILVSENKSFKEILFSIADNLHKKRPSIKVTKTMTDIAWRVSWLVSKISNKEPLLTENSAKSSHHISYYSSKKMTEAFNFNFELIDKTISRICQKIQNSN